MTYLCVSMQTEYNTCTLTKGFKWEWTCFLVQTRFRCVWGKEFHEVESFYICPVLSEVHCALNMVSGKHTCFSCCTELKEKQVWREYRLQVRDSDNAAFFGGQRNAESRLNTMQYVNAMPCHVCWSYAWVLQGEACVCILFWMEYCLLQQSNCPAPIVLAMSWSIPHYWL